MSVKERDHYTGHMTTGHDWNGIKELNTKVPKLLLVCLGLAFLFSLGYWYLLPAWPLGKDYTRGKLLLDQKDEIQVQISDADKVMSEWSDPLLTSSFEDIQADSTLMSIVAESGPALFGDNCAMCHGQAGAGNINFPNLTDSSWLWGGTPEQIQKTLLVGINANVEGTRMAIMPAFGNTGLLKTDEISDVATYLQSLSKGQVGNGARAEEALAQARGSAVYKTNCAACHGVDGDRKYCLGRAEFNRRLLVIRRRQSLYYAILSQRQSWMDASVAGQT